MELWDPKPCVGVYIQRRRLKGFVVKVLPSITAATQERSKGSMMDQPLSLYESHRAQVPFGPLLKMELPPVLK